MTTMISAAILPTGRTIFFGPNGVPLAGGSVYYYVPETTTPKVTWQDPYQTVPNVNPVPLDANGTALVYGSGQYRMVSFDADGNQIEDDLTYGLAASAASGPGFGPQTSIASAATVQLGTIGSHNAIITGNTTINSFGSTDADVNGPLYYVEFDDGAEVTYNNATLQIPGNNNYTFQAGDGALIEYLGGTAWKIIAIFGAASSSSGSFGHYVAMAAANTTDLGTAGTNHVHITAGVSNIASLGSSANINYPIYLVTINSPVIFNAGVNLILPQDQNYYAQGFDNLLFEYNGSGQWTLLGGWHNDGNALSMTGASVNVAAATSTEIGNVGSNLINVTGSGITIDNFGTTAQLNNPLFFVTFANANTLHNNADLIMPGGVDKTTADGDSALLLYLGVNQWQVLSYNDASVPIGTSSPQVLISGTFSARAELVIDLNNWIGEFSRFEIFLQNVKPSVNPSKLQGLFRVNGADVNTGYQWGYSTVNSHADTAQLNNNADTSFELAHQVTTYVQAKLDFNTNLAGGDPAISSYSSSYPDSTPYGTDARGSVLNVNASTAGNPVNGFSFQFNSGTIAGRYLVVGYA